MDDQDFSCHLVLASRKAEAVSKDACVRAHGFTFHAFCLAHITLIPISKGTYCVNLLFDWQVQSRAEREKKCKLAVMYEKILDAKCLTQNP